MPCAAGGRPRQACAVPEGVRRWRGLGEARWQKSRQRNPATAKVRGSQVTRR